MSDEALRGINAALAELSSKILSGAAGTYNACGFEFEVTARESAQEVEEPQGLALLVPPGYASSTLVVTRDGLPVYTVRASAGGRHFRLPGPRIEGDKIQLV
jgi:hypothetical protein